MFRSTLALGLAALCLAPQIALPANADDLRPRRWAVAGLAGTSHFETVGGTDLEFDSKGPYGAQCTVFLTRTIAFRSELEWVEHRRTGEVGYNWSHGAFREYQDYELRLRSSRINTLVAFSFPTQQNYRVNALVGVSSIVSETIEVWLSGYQPVSEAPNAWDTSLGWRAARSVIIGVGLEHGGYGSGLLFSVEVRGVLPLNGPFDRTDFIPPANWPASTPQMDLETMLSGGQVIIGIGY